MFGGTMLSTKVKVLLSDTAHKLSNSWPWKALPGVRASQSILFVENKKDKKKDIHTSSSSTCTERPSKAKCSRLNKTQPAGAAEQRAVASAAL